MLFTADLLGRMQGGSLNSSATPSKPFHIPWQWPGAAPFSQRWAEKGLYFYPVNDGHLKATRAWQFLSSGRWKHHLVSQSWQTQSLFLLGWAPPLRVLQRPFQPGWSLSWLQWLHRSWGYKKNTVCCRHCQICLLYYSMECWESL